MTVEPPIRTSDAERERVLRHLRDRTVEGRLSFDSFIGRVERVYSARTHEDLAAVVGDLPPDGRFERAVVAATGRVSRLLRAVGAAWREPRTGIGGRDAPHALVLPDLPVVTIGRGRDRDLVLDDPSVSRRHAEVCRAGLEVPPAGGGGWLLSDVGSTNGTRVHGVRVRSLTPVADGDHIT